MMSRLNDVWRLLNLRCDGMARLASESLDRELSFGERIALRSHVVYCSACRRYVRQIRRLRSAARVLLTRLETGDPFSGVLLPDDVRDRITHALREH
jgi:Putative zinc-finger